MCVNGILSGLALGFLLMLVMFWRTRTVRERRLQQASDNLSLLKISNFKAVEKLLDTVPRWIQFPEFESVGWLNLQLLEMWPYLNKAIKTSVQGILDPLLDLYKPTVVKHMRIHKITTGGRPPEFEGVRVQSLEPSQVILDLNLVWQGQGRVVIGIKTTTGLALKAQIKDFVFKGQLRVILQLDVVFPCVAAMVVSLYRKRTPPPYEMLYDLKGAGCNLDVVPGLAEMIHKSITAALDDTLLWPNRMVFPIVDGHETRALEFSGEVVVTVLKAEKLQNKELLKFMDKSDPRAVLWLRPQHKARTRVIPNNQNPEWNETFELPVDDPQTAELHIEVQDEDAVGYDPLGYASVPVLSVLEAGEEVEMCLPLCATHSLEECLGEPSLGHITIAAVYRNYTAVEREAVTEAEKQRRGGEEETCLPADAARAARENAIASAKARGVQPGKFRAVGVAADRLLGLQAAVGAPKVSHTGEGPEGGGTAGSGKQLQDSAGEQAQELKARSPAPTATHMSGLPEENGAQKATSSTTGTVEGQNSRFTDEQRERVGGSPQQTRTEDPSSAVVYAELQGHARRRVASDAPEEGRPRQGKGLRRHGLGGMLKSVGHALSRAVKHAACAVAHIGSHD